MNTTATAAAPIEFIPTTLGVNSDVNLINSASRVQVFSFWTRFYVGVPATVRNSGVRGLEGFNTLAEALKFAESLVPRYTKIMDRKHAAALKMNRSH